MEIQTFSSEGEIKVRDLTESYLIEILAKEKVGFPEMYCEKMMQCLKDWYQDREGAPFLIGEVLWVVCGVRSKIEEMNMVRNTWLGKEQNKTEPDQKQLAGNDTD